MQHFKCTHKEHKKKKHKILNPILAKNANNNHMRLKYKEAMPLTSIPVRAVTTCWHYRLFIRLILTESIRFSNRPHMNRFTCLIFSLLFFFSLVNVVFCLSYAMNLIFVFFYFILFFILFIFYFIYFLFYFFLFFFF